ncbi:MAG: hypothetical protein AAF388_24685, partial [Bacteroidota bacterium]
MKRLASKLLILCCLIGGSLSTTHAQTFVKRQGEATDISISPSNGNVYIIGTSKNVFLYNVLQKRFYQYKDRKNNFLEVSETKSGLTCVLDATGTVFTPRPTGNTNQWMRFVSGGPVKQLTTGMDGEIYGISLTGDRVMTVKGGRWEIVNQIPPLNNIKKIAVHNDYYLLAIKMDNSIYEFRNRRWNKLDGSALDITYDKRKSLHYIVGTSRRIFKWIPTTRKWEVLPGTRNDFAVVAAYDGRIWGTTVEQEIYEYTHGEYTAFNPGPSLDFNNYAGTYRVTVTRILGLNWQGHRFNGKISVYMTAKGGTSPGSVSQNIRPLNRRSNIILEEYSRGLLKRPMSPEDPQNFIYISSSGPAEPISNSPYQYAYDFYDMAGVREFKLEGQNANANTELSFKFHLKSYSSTSAKEEEVILKVR